MRKIDNKGFSTYVKSLDSQRRKFVIEKKRSVRTLLMNNKYVILNRSKKTSSLKKDKKKITSLFGQVALSVNKHIIDNGLSVDVVKQVHSSTATNRKKYREMEEGHKFYYVDISHCYWRIAFLKTYITKRLYENVLKKPELKLFRNMALACIVAPRSREYHDEGGLLIEISEDKTLHKQIYENIRFTSWNLMGETAKKVSKDFIAYRTDGILVEEASVKKVQRIFKKHGFDCKVTECIKIDELFYEHNGKKKRL